MENWQGADGRGTVVKNLNFGRGVPEKKKGRGAYPVQLGAAANFDDLVKFGDRRQIRRSQMFIKLAFEYRM